MIYFGYFGSKAESVICDWISRADDFFYYGNLNKFIDEDFAYGIVGKMNEVTTASKSFIDGFSLFGGSAINSYNFNDRIFDQLVNCNDKEKDLCGSFTAFKKYSKEVKFINDYYGARPLFYYCSGHKFFFSNDIVMLLLFDEIPFSVNKKACELYCSSWFTVEENSLGEYTFFKDIKKMPPASILNFDGNALRLHSYYNLEMVASLKYNKFMDLEHSTELFRSTLNEVIHATCESEKNENISISLSGGIDSSTVLGSLISCGLQNKVVCYHLAFKDPALHHVSDHKIVKELISYTNVRGYIVWGDEFLKINNCDLGRDPLVHANGPCCISNEAFYYTVSALMHDNNSSILLGGDGGDYLFMGTKYCGDYYLRNGKFSEAFRRALYTSETQSIFSKLRSILRHNVFPFIPYVCNYEYLKIFWEELFNKIKTPDYMGKLINILDNNLWQRRFSKFGKSKVLRYWYRRFIYDFMFPRGEYVDTRLNGISVYQPLMDNKIFLLALTTPPNLHYNIYDKNVSSYSKRKKLLRYAYKDILPSCIVEQPEKTNYSAVIGLTLQNEKNNLLKLFSNNNILLTSELNLVKKQKFCEKVKDIVSYADDPHYFRNTETNYYMNVIKLEIWLKLVDKGRDYFVKLLKNSKQTKISLDNVEIVG